jgi:hypothetical protein
MRKERKMRRKRMKFKKLAMLKLTQFSFQLIIIPPLLARLRLIWFLSQPKTLLLP